MSWRRTVGTLLAMACLVSYDVAFAQQGKGKKGGEADDPYADIVWPPAPAEPRIKLEAVIRERRDVEGKKRLQKILIGISPDNPYDELKRPHAVDFDSQGRILVTDMEMAALLRLDRVNGTWDVFGTQGVIRLKQPAGIGVGPDDIVYVADVAQKQVLAYDPEGKLVATYGDPALTLPADAAVSPDGTELYVADSRGHRVHVFDRETTELKRSFGRHGTDPEGLNYPSALAFDAEGMLYVVDQMNARVLMLDADGEVIDRFGERGIGGGNFTRPKDVAIDEVGFIYVVDNAFNNVQLFDFDFTLLTFLGQGGEAPGTFWGASGVAVRGDEIAVVDQLGKRLQILRFIVPKES